MKIIQFILLISVLSVFNQSCRKGGPYGVRGRGAQVTETRSLQHFDKVHLSIDADVVYVQDSVYRVEITAQSNILAILDTKVKNATLKFEFKRNVWDYEDITVYVYAPSVSALSISGTGDISVRNPLETDLLDLSISGSGDIEISELTASTLNVSITGTGDVEIASGTVNSAEYYINGSGEINSLGCVAETATCKISGSGNMKVHVTENMDVNISGSGDVSYKGRPAISSKITGSGRLIRL